MCRKLYFCIALLRAIWRDLLYRNTYCSNLTIQHIDTVWRDLCQSSDYWTYNTAQYERHKPQAQENWFSFAVYWFQQWSSETVNLSRDTTPAVNLPPSDRAITCYTVFHAVPWCADTSRTSITFWGRTGFFPAFILSMYRNSSDAKCK